MNEQRIHFLGVGGVSMFSLCLYTRQKGYMVSGTDKVQNDRITYLQENKVDVWTGFLPERTGKPSLCVYSSAIKKSDAELMYLRSNNVECIERFEFLKTVCDDFKNVIAVAGTHGKTTTTSMISAVFKENTLSFFPHIGGKPNNEELFFFSGNDYFLCEACEYKKSLLALKSDISVVLNAEMDHPDTYENQEEVFDTFSTFLSPKCTRGIGIVYKDNNFNNIAKNKNVLTFGYTEDCTYQITDIKEINGKFGFKVMYLGCPIVEIMLSIVGKHNILNATACIAVCHLLRLPMESVKTSLERFSGVERRFEYLGQNNGTKVFSDYAHHPTEIRQSLLCARSVLPYNKSLFVVFQPHTFSRTKCLFNDFVKELSVCEHLVILKEYSAREDKLDGTDARTLYEKIPVTDKKYFSTFLKAGRYLLQKTAPNDIILLVGAGDIDMLGKILIPNDTL